MEEMKYVNKHDLRSDVELRQNAASIMTRLDFYEACWGLSLGWPRTFDFQFYLVFKRQDHFFARGFQFYDSCKSAAFFSRESCPVSQRYRVWLGNFSRSFQIHRHAHHK